VVLGSVIILLVIIIIGRGWIIRANEYNLNDLLIPTNEEAKQMTDQYSDMNGAPYIIQPLSYNLQLAVVKGLCTPWSKYDEKYLYMQALYRKVLEQYLLEQLDLQIYDDMLADSELRFLPVAQEEMSFYQKYSTFGFQYIYLRSNLPIERLSKKDLSILEQCIRSNKTDVTDELLELVARTYHIVVTAYQKKESDMPIGFSNDGRKVAPNEALVLEVRHAREYDENGNIVDGKNEREKKDYVEKEFLPLMQEKLAKEVEIEIVIFIY